MKKQKNSKNKKKKESKIKKETRLEEEIKEAEKAITHRLRETLNDEEKENEEMFFEEPARQIPIFSESSAPVLERIIQEEIPTPVIETQEREETNEKRIDYSPATNNTNYNFEAWGENSEEKKYESNFIPPVLSRREVSNETHQEFLKPMEKSAWSPADENPQLIEGEEMEREIGLPFEEQKKYKRHKLR